MDNAAVRAEIDDLGLIAAVIDDVARRLPIDRAQVYAVGFSAGAMMAHRLGAEAPELFAAIAAVAGPLCVDSHPGGFPVPLIYVHGTADPELFYQGGSRIGRPFPSVRHSLGFWLLRNLCIPAPEVERIAPDVRIEHWRPAVATGAPVTLVTVEGGGNAWPGRKWSWHLPDRDGPLSMTIDATQWIWEFFARHARR
jgi:polyhydroxybutyrate depolymerase